MSVSTIIREANLMRTNPSADEVYTVTETIDPSMAALYLERNEVNRPVRDAHVRKLVRAMKEGSFQQTHQGIAFSKSVLSKGFPDFFATFCLPVTFKSQLNFLASFSLSLLVSMFVMPSFLT